MDVHDVIYIILYLLRLNENYNLVICFLKLLTPLSSKLRFFYLGCSAFEPKKKKKKNLDEPIKAEALHMEGMIV